MRRRTRERIDGVLMIIAAMSSPIGLWAQAGAQTDTASIVGVCAAVVIAGITSVRLWLQKDPRVPPAIEVPVIR